MIKQNKSVKVTKRLRAHKRIRSRISGTESRPRLAVFRSNEYIYAQIINDDTSKTLCAANDLKITGKTKKERAAEVGTNLAKLAQKAGVKEVVFDRAGFKYAGRVEALAAAAREAGLVF